MAIDIELLSVLAEPTARSLFHQIVKKRTVQFNDLVKLGGDRESTKDALDKLKDASLINSSTSIIEDFNTYYVTASGLEASRKVGV